MKTYQKMIRQPQLVIQHDDCESPRTWSNLGYFITCERNHNSPDRNRQLEKIVKETGEGSDNQIEHIARIKEEIAEDMPEDGKVLAVYPVTKYEHSSICYKVGNYNGFDFSQCGFYIITEASQKETGTEPEFFKKCIESELALYSKWVNGENYRFTLYNEKGEIADSCGGFYDIEDIREYLPEEWQAEELEQYLQD